MLRHMFYVRGNKSRKTAFMPSYDISRQLHTGRNVTPVRLFFSLHRRLIGDAKMVSPHSSTIATEGDTYTLLLFALIWAACDNPKRKRAIKGK